MPINQQQLQTALSDPTVAAMDDATAAAQPGWATPLLTPRQGRITITSLAAADVWGFVKADAFHQALIAAGAPAATLLAMLGGPGFDATDPQTMTLAPSFVALSGGSITDADATAALNTSAYLFGAAVAASDVTTARAAMATAAAAAQVAATRQAAIDAVRQWANTYVPQANAILAAAEADATLAVPTIADYVAVIQAGVPA